MFSEYEYEADGCRRGIFVAETADDTDGWTGGCVWPAAQPLAEELLRMGGALRGRKVVELGCGGGLAAAVAALQGASVICTDREIGLAERTAERNAARVREAGGSLRCCELEWEWPLASDLGGAELVVASDCTYTTSGASALGKCAARLLAPGGTFLCVSGRRGDDPLPMLLAHASKAGLELEAETVVDPCEARLIRRASGPEAPHATDGPGGAGAVAGLRERFAASGHVMLKMRKRRCRIEEGGP